MEQLPEDQRREICFHGFNQAYKNLANRGKKHFQTKEEIAKPDVIVYYNISVDGAENFSRVIFPYVIAQKGLKWYCKLAVWNCHGIIPIQFGSN